MGKRFKRGESLIMICLADQKLEMRSVALENREKIAASLDTTRAAISLSANFFSYFGPTRNVSIGLYWPFRQEIDVTHLLNQLYAAGCFCLLPAIIRWDKPLQFREWKPGDVLNSSRFGTFEPPETCSVGTPEILITPLLAFDKTGYRLGYGGGYYDRTLATLRNHFSILAVGAAYEGQKVESVPHNNLDQRLDAVVTEKSVLDIKKK